MGVPHVLLRTDGNVYTKHKRDVLGADWHGGGVVSHGTVPLETNAENLTKVDTIPFASFRNGAEGIEGRRTALLFNESVEAGAMTLTWGTGWELFDLSFFRDDQRVWEFTKKVERSLGHYRFNWGDHMVRAYQVQLFAPLESVRCFDAAEIPGVHGCGAFGMDKESHTVFRLQRHILCPSSWTGKYLTRVPVETIPDFREKRLQGQDHVPQECLRACLEADTECEGFD